MAGWDLKQGIITDYGVSEELLWKSFNFVFSDSSRKRNSYKFGLIKALLDNIFNGSRYSEGVLYTYEELFARFAENYWNLVVKYSLNQMRSDGRSDYSKVELIFLASLSRKSELKYLEFEQIDKITKQQIISNVTRECKRYVIGALYNDFDGILYSFDLKGSGIYVSHCAHEFMLKYKFELERLNYYSWARFLEQVNEDNALIRVIEKIELATPRRKNLSIYREILKNEFEVNTCFYCGKKLTKNDHVDHFIPWSYLKDDKIWNFVLSCAACNLRKNNKIPCQEHLLNLENRNKQLIKLQNNLVISDFMGYTEGSLNRIWNYAQLSGLKEFT